MLLFPGSRVRSWVPSFFSALVLALETLGGFHRARVADNYCVSLRSTRVPSYTRRTMATALKGRLTGAIFVQQAKSTAATRNNTFLQVLILLLPQPQHQYLVIPNRTLPALSPWFCQGCVMWSHDSAQVCARQITHLRAATETVRRQRESFFTSYDGPFARVRARWRCGGWWLALSNPRRLRPETPRERPVPSGGSSRPNAGA